jgi:hypothetical protein
MALYLKTIFGYHSAVALCERDGCRLRYEVRVYHRAFPLDYTVALATGSLSAAERAFDARAVQII